MTSIKLKLSQRVYFILHSCITKYKPLIQLYLYFHPK